MTEKLYLTWNTINKHINSLILDIATSGRTFTQVVGIENGGSYPGQRLAMYLGVPYTGIRISFYNKDNTKGSLSKDSITQFEFDHLFDWDNEKVLFVDDLVDSGTTFKYVKSCLAKSAHTKEPPHGFACIYHPQLSESNDDIFVGTKKPDTWVVFPWETTEENVKYHE